MGHRSTILAACCLPASLALCGVAAPQPLFLINPSTSAPPGLYVRSPRGPRIGGYAAFRTPRPAAAYVEAALPQIGQGGILKMMVAGEGACVCVHHGALWLDGRRLGVIRRRDAQGRALPSWSGCKVLDQGELLAFSDRIPNSFDSRYFGPVPASDMIGAFDPLWTWP